MAAEYEFDMVVIGAGSGGTRLSRHAAATFPGTKVAVVELPFGFVPSETVGGAGGTCVIRGCVPKKLLVYGSEFSHHFEEAAGFGWTVPPASHNWKTVMDNKDKEIQRLNNVYNNIIDKSGAIRIEGRAKLVDPHTVNIQLSEGGERTITGKYVVIATGGHVSIPDIPGKEHAITSDHALALEDLKAGDEVIIIGGGYIAVEFAGIFNGMGAKVHLMYRRELPLRGFDEECRKQVAENLEASGLIVHSSASPVKLTKNDSGTISYTYKGPEGEQTIDGKFVMFATGRAPNVKDLGLKEVGVEMDKIGAIKVDEYSHTNVPSIYAVGDVTNRMNLTPVALMEGMALSHTLFGGKPTKPDYENIASAVFCQPPLATVGLSEEQAIAEFSGDLDVYVSKFKPMKMTFSSHPIKALMKIIVHAESDKVVGVHMVGPDAAEIMQGIGIALKAGATKAVFDSTVGIHPSSAEWCTLLEALRDFIALVAPFNRQSQKFGRILKPHLP